MIVARSEGERFFEGSRWVAGSQEEVGGMVSARLAKNAIHIRVPNTEWTMAVLTGIAYVCVGSLGFLMGFLS